MDKIQKEKSIKRTNILLILIPAAVIMFFIAMSLCGVNSQKSAEEKTTVENHDTYNSIKSDEVPKEYKNALKSAESYSRSCNMSRNRIERQLIEFEHFDKQAVEYALNNANIDYKENALKTANSYYNSQHMSLEGVKRQLESSYEDFTQDEIKYAMDNIDK